MFYTISIYEWAHKKKPTAHIQYTSGQRVDIKHYETVVSNSFLSSTLFYLMLVYLPSFNNFCHFNW